MVFFTRDRGPESAACFFTRDCCLGSANVLQIIYEGLWLRGRELVVFFFVSQGLPEIQITRSAVVKLMVFGRWSRVQRQFTVRSRNQNYDIRNWRLEVLQDAGKLRLRGLLAPQVGLRIFVLSTG